MDSVQSVVLRLSVVLMHIAAQYVVTGSRCDTFPGRWKPLEMENTFKRAMLRDGVMHHSYGSDLCSNLF